jgi:hypothetical protein
MDNFTNQITAEITKAIRQLGGDPETVNLTEDVLAELKRYNAGESLGPDVSFVLSWLAVPRCFWPRYWLS